VTSAKEIVETGLGSVGKVKILRALTDEGRMTTVYLLHKKTGLKRDDIKSNLDDLIKIGWVRQTKYANVTYALNGDNEYVAKLMQFFKDVGYAGQP
jgi:hypothetical protein